MPHATLKVGSRGDDVVQAQRALRNEAHYAGELDGIFGRKTEAAVVYFQQTHLGSDGVFLPATGIVDDATWWALEHPSGEAQRSGLRAEIPGGIGARREGLLSIALHEWEIGVREIPNGSNRGDRPEGGVDKYTGKRAIPWCMAFVRWCWGRAQQAGHVDAEVLEALDGGFSCHRTAVAAQEVTEEVSGRKPWFDADETVYLPRPGDAFVMLFRNSRGNLTFRGHTGFVLRVAVENGKPVAINTVEGNCGNRVKLGYRKLKGSAIEGYVNAFDDGAEAMTFALGTVAAKDVGGAGTR